MNRQSPGFSLVEVLVALVMISLTFTSVLSLQMTLQRMLFNDSMRWRAEQVAYAVFSESEKKGPRAVGESFDYEKDGFKAVCTYLKMADDSSLGKIKDLYREKVTVTWNRLWSTAEITFIRICYRQSSEKNDQPQKKTDGEEKDQAGGQQ